MSATLGGALKAALESAGLGLSVYRDHPPAGAALPYVLVREGIASEVEPAGDFGDPGRQAEEREQAQVEVVQAWKNPLTGARLERYGLAQAAVRYLHGRALEDVLGGRVYPVRVVGRTRIPPATSGDGENIIRDVLTVEALRVVTGTVAAP